MLPLPPDWAAVYKSATEQMFCTNATQQPADGRPSRADHGGGKLIEPDGPEVDADPDVGGGAGEPAPRWARAGGWRCLLSAGARAGAQAAQGLAVRVLSEAAEVRTGPSFAYRAVYVAARGETLDAVDRAPSGLLVQGGAARRDLRLDPGRRGAAPGGRSHRARAAVAGRALRATRCSRRRRWPAPTSACRSRPGCWAARAWCCSGPSVLLAPHLALEGFVGETVGEQVDVIYYGAVGQPVPVAGLARDAVLRPGRRRRARAREGRSDRDRHGALRLTANVGGGLLLAFKKRVTLRFDFRNYGVFDADYTRNLQEYSRWTGRLLLRGRRSVMKRDLLRWRRAPPSG